MTGNVQYPSDLEEGWGISTNGSEFDQSGWPYSNLSDTTEQWMEDDAFMGRAQDNILRTDNNPSEISHLEGFIGPSPERNFPFHPSDDAALSASMSPTPDPSQSFSTFEDEMWASGSGLSEQYRQLSASPHHLATHPTSSEPWDPGHPRVTLYDSGDVAFVDSPKSSSDRSFYEAPREPNASPQGGTTYASQDTSLESLPLESPAVTNQQEWRWEFVNVATNGPPKNDNICWRGSNGCPSKGRHGPLDKQKAKDARIMRKVGVCWPCRVSKVKASSHSNQCLGFFYDEYPQCSLGSPCTNCRDRESSISPLSYQVCCRSGIADFDVLYFPGKLSIH
jgi:hypothetical protein